MPEPVKESQQTTKDPLLLKIQTWVSESEELNLSRVERWKSNLNLYFGIFSEEEKTRSKIRKRSKLFYRKIWATVWRLVASFYGAFLSGQDIFKIEGRDTFNDAHKAAVLQNMVEYRRDIMYRTQSLFVKFIWAFQNISTLGNAVGKLSWKFNAELGQDEPDFVLYPNEQVHLDHRAETKEKMRFVTFVNYMTKEDMEDADYENIDKAQSTHPSPSALRTARYQDGKDPLQNPQKSEYPSPGAFVEGSTNRDPAQRGNTFEVWETFYRVKGEIKFVVTNRDNVILKKEVDSPYGKRYPLVLGSCLTEPHKLLNEGFPEPMEGPQESFNANINMRKDNVAMTLNKGAIVAKRGGVDIKSLTNFRTGRIVFADDVNAVKYEDVPDVTQGAYLEAASDESMMEEMSGITPGKRGQEEAEKATVAQINLSEANAKIDLYIAIIGETWVRDFFGQLTYLVQEFETDETVFRIANDNYKRQNNVPFAEEVFDLGFEADCIINVGVGAASRDLENRQTMLAMDRAIQSNQVMIGMASSGLMPQEELRLFDLTTFMEDLLPKLGKKDVNRYFIKMQQQAPPGGEGGGAQGLIGGPQSQGRDGEALNEANDLQAGGLGSIAGGI